MKMNIVKFIISKFKHEDNRVFIKNILSSFSLYASRYILQFLQMVYLWRVIQPTKYGLLAFGTSFIIYFDIILEYGFNYPATRKVAMNKKDKNVLEEIYNSITTARFILLLGCAAIFFPVVFTLYPFTENIPIYVILFWMLLGYTITSGAFLQGLEKFKIITINYVVFYSLYVVLLIIFVHSPNDVMWAATFETLYIVLIGVANVVIITKKLGIKLRIPTRKELSNQFKEGWILFIHSILYNVYLNSNVFLLGILANNTSVGYYTGALTIINAAQSILNSISAVTYPKMSAMVKESKEKAIYFMKRFFFFSIVLGGLISAGLFFFSDLLVIIFNSSFAESIKLLKIQCLLPLVLSINSTLGFQIMLTLDLKRPFTLIYAGALAICITLSLILVPIYQDVGTAIVVLVVESYVAIIEIIYLNKIGLHIFSGTSTYIPKILKENGEN